MHEDASGFFPEVLVFQVIVHEHVSRLLEVKPLVSGAAGDHAHIGEVPRGPGDLLRLGPSAVRAAGQNDGMEVGDSLVETHGVGEERKIAVEIAVATDPAPEDL